MKFSLFNLLFLISVASFSQISNQKKYEDIYQISDKASFESALNKIEKNIIVDKGYDDISKYGKLTLYFARRFSQSEFALTSFNRILAIPKLPSNLSCQLEINMLWIFLQQDRFDLLVPKCDSLLKKTTSKDQLGWLYYFKGQGENEAGDYKSASSSYLESFKRFDESKNLEGVSYAKTGLGDIQRNLGDIKKSKEYYLEAIASAKQSKEILAEINALSLCGISYSISKDYKSAISYFNEALFLSKKEKDTYNMARCLNNLGNAYVRMGDHSEAIKANKESLVLCLTSQMDYGAIANYLNLARSHNALKKYDQALLYLEKGELFLNGKNFPAERSEILKGYANTYEGLQNYKMALQYYKDYDELRKTLVSEQTQRMVKELQIKYESELKDQKIENATFDLNLKKSQNRNLLLGLGLAILIIIFTIFFLNFRHKKLKELYEKNIESLNAYSFIRKAADVGDPLRGIFDKVLVLLEEEKIYQKTTLSLTELAELVGSNEKYVSSAISKYTDSNYSNFINLYRINEAKRLIHEGLDIQINDVMVNCGFNSRTPFYNAFTKFTGMSPKQFKDLSPNN